jgi:tetrahydromethanopterin S-methyltransferase subunit A
METSPKESRKMDKTKSKKVEEGVTRAMRQVVALKDWLVSGPVRRIAGVNEKESVWPVLPGAYAVGDCSGSIAVCTLTSNELFAPVARLPGVAIAGRVYSANLGLEKVILNVTANPAIRFLLVCGKESVYFQTGQALGALFAHGVTAGGRISGASGHMPELKQVDPSRIERFRKQVDLVNCMGETDLERLADTIRELASRSPLPFEESDIVKKEHYLLSKDGDGFKPVRLGGRRESLAYDPKGFFTIELDRQAGDILVHHYEADHSPAHMVRGRNGEAILLALLREDLISQMSHAGYLGAELTKAETSLRLGLQYEQDKPLRLLQEQGFKGSR